MTQDEYISQLLNTNIPYETTVGEYVRTLEQRIAELEISYTDLEYNSACILEYATGGRASKPHINYEIAHRLIDDNIEYWIKEHITELSALQTCDGCKYEFEYMYLADRTDICTMCSRDSELRDYYEPKDN